MNDQRKTQEMSSVSTASQGKVAFTSGKFKKYRMESFYLWFYLKAGCDLFFDVELGVFRRQ